MIEYSKDDPCCTDSALFFLRVELSATEPNKKLSLIDSWKKKKNEECPTKEHSWQLMYGFILEEIPVKDKIAQVTNHMNIIDNRNGNFSGNQGSKSNFVNTYSTITANVQNSEGLTPELTESFLSLLNIVKESDLEPDEKQDTLENVGKLVEELEKDTPSPTRLEKLWNWTVESASAIQAAVSTISSLAESLALIFPDVEFPFMES